MKLSKIRNYFLWASDIYRARKRLFDCIEKDKDYDWAFLMRLEQTKLKNMSEYFQKYGVAMDNNIMIKQINLCVKLIDIIIDEFPEEKEKYVNIKNAHRFLNKELIEKTKETKYLKDDLYIKKAENLYYKIRKEYTRTWWD